MPNRMLAKQACYCVLGYLALALGVIGIFLPVMPTTCFLIIAVWAFARSNPAKSEQILNHPRFGPSIRDWIEYRVISRKTKYTITGVVLLTSIITILIVGYASLFSLCFGTGMLALLVYINCKPEHINIELTSNGSVKTINNMI